MNLFVRDAMNTIPTTFNEMLPSYTVVGGREQLASTGLSAILLNRGRRFTRRNLFHDLEKTGFDTIISVEPSPPAYDIEELSVRFPFVRFVLLQQPISLGEQINLAVSELNSPLFFVLWNDLKIITGGMARRMAERLTISDDEREGDREKSSYKRLCTVPIIQTARFETLPTLIVPALQRKKVRVLFLGPSAEGISSLYPFDGVGVYDRERFVRLGGFDGTLKNSYWQLMDFGFRAHLWGEEITSTQALKLSYESTVPAEESSGGADYNRFYLKNIAPVFQHDCAHLPLRRFPGFLMQTNDGIFDAWEHFSESRRWVNANRFRWHYDPRTIVKRWDLESAEETFFPGNGGR
ncbi:MAG: hypothetical protein LBI06_04925 [Treponema sp.]|jgi:hypothetical protein|nr:hypothetical protein [Treponema sp.]